MLHKISIIVGLLVLLATPALAQQSVKIIGGAGGVATVTGGKLDVNATISGTGTVTANQGTAGTNAQAWWTQVGDTANGPVAVKAASTAPGAADKALVVSISPNSVNANGQATMANSSPVVIASNQTALPTTLSTGQTTTGTASASFTSGTTAYAANDVVGGALTFSAACPASSNVMITGVQLEQDAAAIISGETSFTLYLYSVTPPSAIADSSQFDLPSGDRASWLGGPISIGVIADLGSTLYVEANGVNKQVQCAASGNLFGYLVTPTGTYTPLAQVYKVTLHATPL